MKALAIIPARYQSSRFPGKPLIDIAGKSLLQRTWEQVQKSSSISDTLIATDDMRILEHAQAFGAKVEMTSSDCPTGSDRLAEVVKNHPELLSFDVIVNVQGDEPLIDPETITKVAKILVDNPKAAMATAVTLMESEEDFYNPNVVKCVMAANGQALYFSRSPIPGSKKAVMSSSSFRHIGIYAYRPSFLPMFVQLSATPLMLHEDLEQLKALEHGYIIQTVKVPPQAPGVDTPEDIEKVLRCLE